MKIAKKVGKRRTASFQSIVHKSQQRLSQSLQQQQQSSSQQGSSKNSNGNEVGKQIFSKVLRAKDIYHGRLEEREAERQIMIKFVGIFDGDDGMDISYK